MASTACRKETHGMQGCSQVLSSMLLPHALVAAQHTERAPGSNCLPRLAVYLPPPALLPLATAFRAAVAVFSLLASAAAYHYTILSLPLRCSAAPCAGPSLNLRVTRK
jgi:hypothetical protein